MSDLSVNSILDATGGATTTINGFTPTVSNMAGRNRIINGDMRIDQRNAGAAVASLGAATTYITDRFYYQTGNAARFSSQQNAGAVTPPGRFVNYLGFTSLGANAPAVGDYGIASQAIEGLNAGDLGWGTSDAAVVTLSFWVRSSITGTQSIALLNAASNRSYSQTYNISSANTWEFKAITVPGDTTGTWAKDNTTSIYVRFPLSVGTDNLTSAGAWNASNSNGAIGTVAISATSGATFYITGVQLEEGSVATPFERRPIGVELALCQRYLFALNTAGTTTCRFGTGPSFDATGAIILASLPVRMRATPTLTFSALSDWVISSGTVSGAITSVNSETSGMSPDGFGCQLVASSASFTANQSIFMGAANANARMFLTAEL